MRHVPRNTSQSQRVPQQCCKGSTDGRGAGTAGREVGPDISRLEALLSLADVQWAALAYLEVEFLPRLWIGVDRVKARLGRDVIDRVRDGVPGARQRVDGF